MRIVFLLAIFLTACSTPPDILGCTPYVAEDWPEMRETFFKLCSDTPSCKARLVRWKEVISHWSYPSDSGTCITWMSKKIYDIDASHPAPIKNDEGPNKGKNKTWPELAETGIFLPAKESVAPMKTWIQSQCHNRKECGEAGKWQSTIKETNETLDLQSSKVTGSKKGK